MAAPHCHHPDGAGAHARDGDLSVSRLVNGLDLGADYDRALLRLALAKAGAPRPAFRVAQRPPHPGLVLQRRRRQVDL